MPFTGAQHAAHQKRKRAERKDALREVLGIEPPRVPSPKIPVPTLGPHGFDGIEDRPNFCRRCGASRINPVHARPESMWRA